MGPRRPGRQLYRLVGGERQLIELTAAGRERLEGVRQAREEWLATSFQSHFTEDERQLIIAAMALLERLTG